MSTTSDRGASGSRPRGRIRSWFPGAAAVLLALGGCLQGPWDYYPEDPPVFRGIWLNGYAMAGKPISLVCMEGFIPITDEHTDAFAFFDSASVQVTGRFGDSTGTLTLAQRSDAPNCFAGDTAALVQKGQDYDLVARVVWDSSGTRVVSTLTATARVPASFSIKDSAVAPSFARTGGLPPNIFTLEFAASLPEEVQQDSILSSHFLKANALWRAGDTAGYAEYLRKHGEAVQERVAMLLRQFQIVYPEGDTLFYLGGLLNTFSHYFTAENPSPDVGAVLITHRFDSTAERPQTAFEGIFGTKPDSSDFYFEGSVRRLGLYPAARSPQGYNLLDSIGVVNAWFHTGLNRLYFYGMESAYLDYFQTVEESEENPRLKPQYNVRGGAGFFVGGVPDSFLVVIEVDSFTNSYSLPEVHGFQCKEKGWYSNKDCSTYYRTYCEGKGWAPATCGVDAVNANLTALLEGDTALLAATDSAADSARTVPATEAHGILRYCVENDFPALNGTCDDARGECGRPGINPCKESLWSFCKDVKWGDAYPQCGEGLAWYCRDKQRPSEVMCRHADAFCRDNPGNAACR